MESEVSKSSFRAEDLSSVRLPGIGIFDLPGIDNATTLNGRLLMEYRASSDAIDHAIAQGVPMKLMACPYRDHRRGLEMNVSAKDAMASKDGWQPLLDGLAWMNELYFEGRDVTRVALAEAYTMTGMIEALPVYLFVRDKDPVDATKVPNVVGDMYKVAAGLSVELEELLVAEESDEVTPESIYAYADANILLVSDETKQACAGSPTMIIESLSALFHRQNARADESELEQLIGDRDGFRAFAIECHSYRVTQLAYAEARQKFASFIGSLFGDPKTDLSIPEVLAMYHDFEQIERTFLEGAAGYQVLLNLHAGRDIRNMGMPTVADLDRTIGGVLPMLRHMFRRLQLRSTDLP